MATVLLTQHVFAQPAYQNKKQKTDGKAFFGKKKYDYKNFGKQNFEENLKYAKKRNQSGKRGKSFQHLKKFKYPGSKKLDYPGNSLRKKKGFHYGNGKHGNHKHGSKKYYDPEAFYGFSHYDFGYDASFNYTLERAAYITENMDDYLDLCKNQSYDVFRLNVLFITDMNELMYHSNGYAYGASYNGNGQYSDYRIKDIITKNYLDALEDILRNNQERRLKKYFRKYDLMGNNAYINYNSYNDYGNYGRCH